MLEIRPICENCGKSLPNDAGDAMICSFECTFCAECVTDILRNVCPNCGGSFEKRPTRPVSCFTVNCVSNYPVGTEKKLIPVNWGNYRAIQDAFVNIDPRKR